jgi:hypothetical protein
MFAAGLRAAGTARHDSAGASRLTLADQIVADSAHHALHPYGRWQRAADDPGLDAALLLPPLRGAVPPDDPRTAATLEAYLREVTVDGYAFRFRHDERPLAEAEGSFLLCGFLVALALQQAGHRVEARAWFERTRAATGPPVITARNTTRSSTGCAAIWRNAHRARRRRRLGPVGGHLRRTDLGVGRTTRRLGIRGQRGQARVRHPPQRANLAVMAELHQAQRADESGHEPPAQHAWAEQAAPSQRGRTIKSVGLGVLTALAIRALFAGRRDSSA